MKMLSFTNSAPSFPETTYCYNVERIPRPSGGTIVKMYCPVLMSGMSHGTSVSAVRTNPASPFINASACKPAISTPSAQSYIQFTCQYNSTFAHLVDITDHVPAMTRFKCQLSNGLPIIRSFSTDL